MPFKLLVFDWDGTLMDSEARIVDCMQAAAADLDIPVPLSQSVREIIGLELGKAIGQLFQTGDPAFIQGMVERYRYHYLQDSQVGSPLFHGADQVIHQLFDAGFMLAVATGKGRQGLDKVLKETALGDFFLTSCCADEAFSKPHPEMLQQVMDELGADLGETLMIGDTEFDMQMAGNAGVAALAVSYGVHDRERLMQHNPLGCLDAIGELPGWLKSHAS